MGLGKLVLETEYIPIQSEYKGLADRYINSLRPWVWITTWCLQGKEMHFVTSGPFVLVCYYPARWIDGKNKFSICVYACYVFNLGLWRFFFSLSLSWFFSQNKRVAIVAKSFLQRIIIFLLALIPNAMTKVTPLLQTVDLWWITGVGIYRPKI